MLAAAAALVLAVQPSAPECEILDSVSVDMGYRAGFNVLCIGESPSGDVVAGGVTSEGVDYMSRAFTVCLGPGWDVRWNGLVQGVNAGWINAVSPTWDGGCICAGATDYAPDDRGDAWVVALDPGGFSRWQHHRDRGDGLAEAVWAGGTAAGVRAVWCSDDVAGGRPASWLVELDADGRPVTTVPVGTEGFRARGACSTSTGEVLVVGSRYGSAAAFMVDGTEEPVWSDLSIAEGDLTAAEEAEGGYLAGGWSRDGGAMLCMFSSVGGSRWTRRLGEEGYTGRVVDLAPIPGIGSVLVITGAPELLVCDRQGRPLGEVDPGFPPAAVAALRDGTLAVAGGGEGVVRLVRLEMGTGTF